MRQVPVPSEVEILASLLLGPDDGAPPVPAPSGEGVLAALERAVLPALQRAPCLVSFSGGRDSSAVLALATDVARRHGLPEPVPAILRFPAAPESDEREWQQLVLDHLRLRNAEVVELSDELDALGPAATAFVRAHGVRWPGNAYMHAPLLELARGGALLTGAGGDELLSTKAARHVWVARGRTRPRPGDVRALLAASLPRRVKAARWRRRHPARYPWLTAEGAARVHRALAAEEVAWPPRWDRSVWHWYRSRAYAAVNGILTLPAREHDVMVVNPLVEPDVLAELTREGGATGFPGRDHAMRRLFGELLPAALLTRPTKASFRSPLWGASVRAFAQDWQGEGVDGALVDVDALRRLWLSQAPDFRTVLLLHRAWLGRAR